MKQKHNKNNRNRRNLKLDHIVYDKTNKYEKKNLTKKDFTFDNRHVKVSVTKDEEKMLDHVVWCLECNQLFTKLIMHAKTSDNERMRSDCIISIKKYEHDRISGFHERIGKLKK